MMILKFPVCFVCRANTTRSRTAWWQCLPISWTTTRPASSTLCTGVRFVRLVTLFSTDVNSMVPKCTCCCDLCFLSNFLPNLDLIDFLSSALFSRPQIPPGFVESTRSHRVEHVRHLCLSLVQSCHVWSHGRYQAIDVP